MCAAISDIGASETLQSCFLASPQREEGPKPCGLGPFHCRTNAARLSGGCCEGRRAHQMRSVVTDCGIRVIVEHYQRDALTPHAQAMRLPCGLDPSSCRINAALYRLTRRPCGGECACGRGARARRAQNQRHRKLPRRMSAASARRARGRGCRDPIVRPYPRSACDPHPGTRATAIRARNDWNRRCVRNARDRHASPNGCHGLAPRSGERRRRRPARRPIMPPRPSERGAEPPRSSKTSASRPARVRLARGSRPVVPSEMTRSVNRCGEVRYVSSGSGTPRPRTLDMSDQRGDRPRKTLNWDTPKQRLELLLRV